MPEHVENEIRANTPEPQSLVEVAENQTANVTATGEWFCEGIARGPGGNTGDPKANGECPVPGANQNCLVIIVTRAAGTEKVALTRDDESLEFTGPCSLTFVPNGPSDMLDENFGLITVRVDIAD
jgi:hypothetical protein